jgi:hypothetical protein
MEAELLRAVLSLRRLFDETIEIDYYTEGLEEGMLKTITIKTKTEAGKPVNIVLNYTYMFDGDKLKKTIIEKSIVYP